MDAKPDNKCLVYDARSSALEKLGKHRDALKDVRKTIELAPEQWQGYLRAARLFHHLRKHSNAMVMVDMALDKCPESLPRRSEIEALKIKIRTAQVEHIRRTQNHSAILPIELFTEIVHILIDDDPTSLLQVSHVCRHWQSVIGANPLFWRTLVISRNRPHIKAKLWVTRSQGKIRDLRVTAAAVSKGWTGQGLEGIRWEHLKACSVTDWELHKYLGQVGDLTKLDSLESYECISSTRLSDSCRLFHATWPIQRLSLQGTPLPASFKDLSPEALRSLSLRRLTDVAPISLEPLTSLEVLVMENETRPITSYPPELPHLHHLEIHRVTRFTAKILDVPMPDLRVLHIQNSSPILYQELASLTQHGTTRLSKIVLSGVVLDKPQTFIALLQANPLLESLELSRMSGGVEQVVKALYQMPDTSTAEEHQGHEPLCPNLVDLNLSNCVDVTAPPLVRLVGTRKASETCSNIRSMTIDGCTSVDAGKLEWFRNHVPVFSCIYRTKNLVKYRR